MACFELLLEVFDKVAVVVAVVVDVLEVTVVDVVVVVAVVSVGGVCAVPPRKWRAQCNGELWNCCANGVAALAPAAGVGARTLGVEDPTGVPAVILDMV